MAGISELGRLRESVKARNYTRELKKIKPKRTRFIIKPAKDIWRIHGAHTGGFAIHGKKYHTVIISPNRGKDAIAHEFGHIALGHRDVKRETIGVYARKELEAWQWADENWRKPNKWLMRRQTWIGTVVGQVMHEKNLGVETSLNIVEKQMKVLNMKPLGPSEEKSVRTRSRFGLKY